MFLLPCPGDEVVLKQEMLYATSRKVAGSSLDDIDIF
jgi:hypothetical protein